MGHRRPAASLCAVLAIAAILFTGCGGTATRGQTTLVFWGLGREGEVVQQLTAGFERENPGIRVVVQQIPWTAAHEKLLTAFVGDALPDLAQVGNTWVSELAVLAAIEPLDLRVAGSAVVGPEHNFPGIWETNVLERTVYGVPWYVDTRLLFYRRDILNAAGVKEAPRSWDEWVAAMRLVKAAGGPEKYAIFLPADEWAQPVILAMEAGATILRDGGRYGAFQDAAFRKAFELYLSLFRERLAPPFGNAQVANRNQQFGEGFFAMYITGPWNLGEFRRRLPAALQDAWTTAPMPAPRAQDAPGVSLAGGASLVIFRSSHNQNAAWQLIEYLSRPEQQVAFYRASGDLPAHRAAWEDPLLAGDERARAFREQLVRTAPTPKVPEWEQIASRVGEVAEAAVLGRMSTDEALATLDRDVDRMLAKRRWLLARHRGET